MAIINNRPVKTGDTINDARVVQIDKKEVVLEHKGKRIRLTIAKG
ncbi:MAG: general secretion pathway protein GspB [candidate division Zixibacteria bacterium]|nr:general secretion pathway protein GspB [candidate division Zixibacteria bacterium]